VKWRDSLNRIVVGSFGIQAESYSVWLVEIRLSCGWVAFRVWHCFARVAEWIIEKLRQNKARKILERKSLWWEKLQGRWGIRLQIVWYNHTPQVFWDYIRGIWYHLFDVLQ
jgi:hypothetical protein